MSAENVEQASRSSRPLVVAAAWLLGIAVVVFVRYRGQWEAYMRLHRWAKEAGFPDAVRNYDQLVLYVLAALLGAAIAAFVLRSPVTELLRLRTGRRGWGRVVLLALAPMVLGGAVLFFTMGPGSVPTTMPAEEHWLAVLSRKVLRPALGEELIFRGLLVAIPAAVLGWCGRGFWATAIPASLCFGLLHASWDARLLSAWPAILVTFVGGLWFCWLLARWGTLWVPIVLHGGMNLGWLLIGATGGAGGGGWVSNGLRAATITIATVLTLRVVRRDTAPACGHS